MTSAPVRDQVADHLITPVHSTVNVASGQGKPTIPELAGLLALR